MLQHVEQHQPHLQLPRAQVLALERLLSRACASSVWPFAYSTAASSIAGGTSAPSLPRPRCTGSSRPASWAPSSWRLRRLGGFGGARRRRLRPTDGRRRAGPTSWVNAASPSAASDAKSRVTRTSTVASSLLAPAAATARARGRRRDARRRHIVREVEGFPSSAADGRAHGGRGRTPRLDSLTGGFSGFFSGFLPKREKAKEPNQRLRETAGPAAQPSTIPARSGQTEHQLRDLCRAAQRLYASGARRNTTGTMTHASCGHPRRAGREPPTLDRFECRRVQKVGPAGAVEFHLRGRALGAHAYAQRDRTLVAAAARGARIARRGGLLRYAAR